MSTPEYGQQPYYAPVEGIAITFLFSRAFGGFFEFFKPKIFVDGVEIPIQGWGHSNLLVPAGRHQVHVYTKYFFPPRTGPADYTVDVPPGEFVELEYRAPVFTFARGSLGPPPQRYRGVWPVVALIGGGLLFIALMLILSAV
jgi:hypothetical protein